MNWLSWSILSALFAGLTAILAKIGVKNVDSNLATAIRTSVILIFAWLVAWISNRQPLQALTPRAWVFLVLSGLATGASWLCYFRALQLGKASQVAPVDKLSVVVAMVLAAIFLGESLTWVHWLGGFLIVSGARHSRLRLTYHGSPVGSGHVDAKMRSRHHLIPVPRAKASPSAAQPIHPSSAHGRIPAAPFVLLKEYSKISVHYLSAGACDHLGEGGNSNGLVKEVHRAVAE